ncbi:hypothetical protein HK102_005507 [Quaeritorhiza haematococci]|nr:hypothetical protein HK102_005507 [Quaeritorhiza haematococci]
MHKLEAEALQTVELVLATWDQRYLTTPTPAALKTVEREQPQTASAAEGKAKPSEQEEKSIQEGVGELDEDDSFKIDETGSLDEFSFLPALPSSGPSSQPQSARSSVSRTSRASRTSRTQKPGTPSASTRPSTTGTRKQPSPQPGSAAPRPAHAGPESTWRYYTKRTFLDEKQGLVRFFTVWSQPTIRMPIPRATAGVWFTYQKNVHSDNTPPTLTYRFENHSLTHTIPLPSTTDYTQLKSMIPKLLDPNSTAFPLKSIGSPAKRLPELIANKLRISDAIAQGKFLSNRIERMEMDLLAQEVGVGGRGGAGGDMRKFSNVNIGDRSGLTGIPGTARSSVVGPPLGRQSVIHNGGFAPGLEHSDSTSSAELASSWSNIGTASVDNNHPMAKKDGPAELASVVPAAIKYPVNSYILMSRGFFNRFDNPTGSPFPPFGDDFDSDENENHPSSKNNGAANDSHTTIFGVGGGPMRVGAATTTKTNENVVVASTNKGSRPSSGFSLGKGSLRNSFTDPLHSTAGQDASNLSHGNATSSSRDAMNGADDGTFKNNGAPRLSSSEVKNPNRVDITDQTRGSSGGKDQMPDTSSARASVVKTESHRPGPQPQQNFNQEQRENISDARNSVSQLPGISQQPQQQSKADQRTSVSDAGNRASQLTSPAARRGDTSIADDIHAERATKGGDSVSRIPQDKATPGTPGQMRVGTEDRTSDKTTTSDGQEQLRRGNEKEDMDRAAPSLSEGMTPSHAGKQAADAPAATNGNRATSEQQEVEDQRASSSSPAASSSITTTGQATPQSESRIKRASLYGRAEVEAAEDRASSKRPSISTAGDRVATDTETTVSDTATSDGTDPLIRSKQSGGDNQTEVANSASTPNSLLTSTQERLKSDDVRNSIQVPRSPNELPAQSRRNSATERVLDETRPPKSATTDGVESDEKGIHLQQSQEKDAGDTKGVESHESKGTGESRPSVVQRRASTDEKAPSTLLSDSTSLGGKRNDEVSASLDPSISTTNDGHVSASKFGQTSTPSPTSVLNISTTITAGQRSTTAGQASSSADVHEDSVASSLKDNGGSEPVSGSGDKTGTELHTESDFSKVVTESHPTSSAATKHDEEAKVSEHNHVQGESQSSSAPSNPVKQEKREGNPTTTADRPPLYPTPSSHTPRTSSWLVYDDPEAAMAAIEPNHSVSRQGSITRLRLGKDKEKEEQAEIERRARGEGVDEKGDGAEERREAAEELDELPSSILFPSQAASRIGSGSSRIRLYSRQPSSSMIDHVSSFR